MWAVDLPMVLEIRKERYGLQSFPETAQGRGASVLRRLTEKGSSGTNHLIGQDTVQSVRMERDHPV